MSSVTSPYIFTDDFGVNTFKFSYFHSFLSKILWETGQQISSYVKRAPSLQVSIYTHVHRVERGISPDISFSFNVLKLKIGITGSPQGNTTKNIQAKANVDAENCFSKFFCEIQKRCTFSKDLSLHHY